MAEIKSGKLTGKQRTSAMMVRLVDVAVVPAIFRGGEVYDSVPLLLPITSVSWSSSSLPGTLPWYGWRRLSPVKLRRAITGVPVLYRWGKRVRTMLYCNRKRLGQKLGAEVVKI